jgi:hypothetical protein
MCKIETVSLLTFSIYPTFGLVKISVSSSPGATAIFPAIPFLIWAMSLRLWSEIWRS